jgi:hypothetical protein
VCSSPLVLSCVSYAALHCTLSAIFLPRFLPWVQIFPSGSCSQTPSLRKGFEVFTAVTKMNTVLWDMTPRGSCKNRRFGGKYHLHHQGGKISELGTSAVTSN